MAFDDVVAVERSQAQKEDTVLVSSVMCVLSVIKYTGRQVQWQFQLTRTRMVR